MKNISARTQCGNHHFPHVIERGLLWVVKIKGLEELCNLFFLYFEILYQRCMENKLYVTILCGMNQDYLNASKCHEKYGVFFDFVDIHYFVTCCAPSENSMMV